MSRAVRRDRKSFRPTLDGIRLEARVVLNGASPAAQVMAARAQAAADVQETLGDITRRQLLTAYRQQFRTAQANLQRYVGDQVTKLYSATSLGADGLPTKAALGDFSNTVAGSLNAMALGLSAQVSLLPGSGRRLVPFLQDSILGGNPASLASRIARSVDSPNIVGDSSLFRNVVDRQIAERFGADGDLVSAFIGMAPLNRLSVDPTTGSRVSLSRFIGGQASRQINNAFGALANSVGPNARAALFDSNGVFNPQAAAGFQQQFSNALGTAGFQVGNVLSVLPNSSSVRSGLQSAFFGDGASPGTGTANAGFLGALTGVFPTNTSGTGTPFTSDAFDTAFQNNFTSSFQNFTTPINSFLNISGTSIGDQLPTGFFQTGTTFPSLLSPQFTGASFNSGFNSGFSSTGAGFPGFGIAPAGFNANFGTGFNGLVSGVNQQFGLTQPTFGTGIGGTGIGGIGTGGIGTGGIGTGGIGTGTGVGTGVIDTGSGLIGGTTIF